MSIFEAEPPEEAVGITILALWLVLAVIVLLNMLIALISNSFQRVQVYYWGTILLNVDVSVVAFIRIMLILSGSSLVPSSFATSGDLHRFLFQSIFFTTWQCLPQTCAARFVK